MIPPYGGTLDFNGNGIAGCNRCGWRGVPTFLHGTKVGKPRFPFGPDTTAECYKVINSERQVTCPACDAEPYDLEWYEQQEVPKVGRNEPCPCGSGKKYKKCHGGVSV